MTVRFLIVSCACCSGGGGRQSGRWPRKASRRSTTAFSRPCRADLPEKRRGHTRCDVCHADSNNAFRLEKLPPGSKVGTEEQSRSNFAMVSKLVVPGDPATSMLLMHPLAPEAGGHVFHSGGRQFASKNDRDWKTLVQWINGTK